ncbi:hypothetical protein [Thauera sp. SDU_THAU2]|uniref:hypothetical protein n=1 Tax=Thauera sp. SDU_THAU2 TaxID=3136633 RepID=UPI00311ED455
MQDCTDWTRLDAQADRRFRLQQAALIEYARTTLPTRLSRRVVTGGRKDPSATPAEIWRRGDEWALVWHVRHESADAASPSQRAVGFLRKAPDRPVIVLAPADHDPLPACFADAEPILFTAEFWRSDRVEDAAPPRPSTSPPAASPPAPAPASAATPGPEPAPAARATAGEAAEKRHVQRIEEAHKAIDTAFRKQVAKDTSLPLVDFSLSRIETPPAATDWRLQPDLTERARVAILLKEAQVCNFHLEAKSTERMVLLERAVPFYKDCCLYRVIDMRGPRSRFASFVLHRPTADLAALSTMSAPIHAFNQRRHARGELLIDDASAGAYLRFFCEFIHAEAGAFSVVEHPHEIRWLTHRQEGESTTRKAADTARSNRQLKSALLGALAPVSLYEAAYGPAAAEPQPEPAPEQQPAAPGAKQPSAQVPTTLYCRAWIGHGRHLFAAGMAVHRNGSVDMFEDEPLHESALPIQPLSFNVEFQFTLRTDERKVHRPPETS